MDTPLTSVGFSGKGIGDMLQKRIRPITDMRKTIKKWLSSSKEQTLLGKQVKGSWPRQKRGEAIIDKLNEEMSNWKDLRRSAQSSEMTAEIPSEATRIANLMAMPESKSAM